MRTRLVCLAIALLVLSSCAVAQEAKWKNIRNPRWGFAFQLPANCIRQRIEGQPALAACDVYASGGLAYVIRVSQTASDSLASTAIEQSIQTDLKQASKLGQSSRWESTSKKGDLFKGFTGRLELNSSDATQAAIIKAIGSDRAIQSVALASLGDESAPVIRIAVIGTAEREGEVVATAKEVSSLVTTKLQPLVQIPAPPPGSPARPIPGPAPRPIPTPEVAPAPVSWPALENGKIELKGIVDSVSRDGKTVTMTVDTIKLPGQELIELNPKRSKKVILKVKMNTLIKGLQIRLIGRNDGVGKPITADAVELMPAAPPAPKSSPPPGPSPIS